MGYKYQQIRDLILECALKTGAELLPSEHQICSQYGVSRTTAMKALNSLAKDQLVRREVGRGTFINKARVRTRVGFLISKHTSELVRFAEEAAALFTASTPYVEVRVHPIDTRDWLSAIVNIPGPKVICSSHTGFLADMNLLYPLSRMADFQETLSHINADLALWYRDRTGELVCSSLPVFSAPEILAYNKRCAEQLDLDADRGPLDWDDIRRWTQAASGLKKGGRPVMGCHIKRDNLLPLSYYLTLSGGKDFIREVDGHVEFAFDRGQEWMEFFSELYKTGRMNAWEPAEPDPILFGRSLISLSASCWILSQPKEYRTRDPIGICPIPPVRSGQASFASVGKAEVAVVGDPTAEPSELEPAWRFVRFLMVEPEAQRIITRLSYGLATNRAVYQQQQADARWAPFIQAFATGRRRNDHPAQHYLMKIVYKYYYAAVTEGMPCAEAAEKIQEGCRLQLEINDGTHV